MRIELGPNPFFGSQNPFDVINFASKKRHGIIIGAGEDATLALQGKSLKTRVTKTFGAAFFCIPVLGRLCLKTFNKTAQEEKKAEILKRIQKNAETFIWILERVKKRFIPEQLWGETQNIACVKKYLENIQSPVELGKIKDFTVSDEDLIDLLGNENFHLFNEEEKRAIKRWITEKVNRALNFSEIKKTFPEKIVKNRRLYNRLYILKLRQAIKKIIPIHLRDKIQNFSDVRDYLNNRVQHVRDFHEMQKLDARLSSFNVTDQDLLHILAEDEYMRSSTERNLIKKWLKSDLEKAMSFSKIKQVLHAKMRLCKKMPKLKLNEAKERFIPEHLRDVIQSFADVKNYLQSQIQNTYDLDEMESLYSSFCDFEINFEDLRKVLGHDGFFEHQEELGPLLYFCRNELVNFSDIKQVLKVKIDQCRALFSSKFVQAIEKFVHEDLRDTIRNFDDLKSCLQDLISVMPNSPTFKMLKQIKTLYNRLLNFDIYILDLEKAFDHEYLKSHDLDLMLDSVNKTLEDRIGMRPHLTALSMKIKMAEAFHANLYQSRLMAATKMFVADEDVGDIHSFDDVRNYIKGIIPKIRTLENLKDLLDRISQFFTTRNEVIEELNRLGIKVSNDELDVFMNCLKDSDLTFPEIQSSLEKYISEYF